MNLPATINLSHQPNATSPPLVLAIEDSDEDYETLQRFFRQVTVQVQFVRQPTGTQAIAYLEQCFKSLPSLILLDLNLPGMSGHSVLKYLRQDPRFQHIPIVIMTTSNDPNEVIESYRLGANSFVSKGMNLALSKQTIQSIVDYWFNTVVLPSPPDTT